MPEYLAPLYRARQLHHPHEPPRPCLGRPSSAYPVALPTGLSPLGQRHRALMEAMHDTVTRNHRFATLDALMHAVNVRELRSAI